MHWLIPHFIKESLQPFRHPPAGDCFQYFKNFSTIWPYCSPAIQGNLLFMCCNKIRETRIHIIISAGRTRKYYESTFLATNLIAKHLLVIEDSHRIRKLISNTYLSQYYNMYPHFPDLIAAHEKQISIYGGGTIRPDGGKVFKLLKAITGWKMAKRLQAFFYKIGYQPVHPGLKNFDSRTA